MRLPQFIIANVETILAEFEEFARTHTSAGESMDIAALRDHAAGILEAIALDIEQPQSEAEQRRKAEGDAPVDVNAAATAAELHGTDRAGSGFTLAEMFSEYRALRASVLRLWTQARHQLNEEDLQDMIRFNEGIDQAMAESITKYSTGIDHSREMFLAILGHDLRAPLGAVLTAAEFLVTDGELAGRNLTMASTVRSSGKRMLALVSDLVDLTRSHLGRGIPIARTEMDIATVARESLEEARARHPDREFRFSASGDFRGRWDSKRVSQALTNLIENAVQHGAPGSPIMVTLRGDANRAVIAIQNRGVVIPISDQEQIFNPFTSITSVEGGEQDQGGMGLGLYIAQQIGIAHGGGIEVESSEEDGTTFELHLAGSV